MQIIDFKFTDVKSTLNKLHLLKGDNLLKAGEILFCDDNPYEVQAAVFAGRNLAATSRFAFLKWSEYQAERKRRADAQRAAQERRDAIRAPPSIDL